MTTPNADNGTPVEPGMTETPAEVDSTTQAPIETHGKNGDAATDDQPQPGRRAAQYRERAQAAEARVAELETGHAGQAAVIESLQRRLVEVEAQRVGVKAEALLAVLPLSDMLGDDGLPSAEKLAEAVALAKTTLGVRPTPGVVRKMGLTDGASGPPQPPRDGWTEAFGRRDR